MEFCNCADSIWSILYLMAWQLLGDLKWQTLFPVVMFVFILDLLTITQHDILTLLTYYYSLSHVLLFNQREDIIIINKSNKYVEWCCIEKQRDMVDLKPIGFRLFPQVSLAVKRIALYKTAPFYVASLSSGVLQPRHLVSSRIFLSSHSYWIFLWVVFYFC